MEGKHNVVGHCTGCIVVLVDVLVMWVAFAVTSYVRPRVAVVVHALWGQHHVRSGWRWSYKLKKKQRTIKTANYKQWFMYNLYNYKDGNLTVPTNPPIKKQVSWQKSNDKTSTNSFLPLKFSSITPPAIVILVFRVSSRRFRREFLRTSGNEFQSAFWPAGRLDE